MMTHYCILTPRTFLPDVLDAIRRREALYPPLISAGKLDGAAAEREIHVWNTIARDCRFAGEGTAAPRPDEPSAEEKIAVLKTSIRRYDRALAKAIEAAPDDLRRDCIDGACLHQLEQLYGDAIQPIHDIHDQRERMERLRDWYRGGRREARSA